MKRKTVYAGPVKGLAAFLKAMARLKKGVIVA